MKAKTSGEIGARWRIAPGPHVLHLLLIHAGELEIGNSHIRIKKFQGCEVLLPHADSEA